MINYIKYQCTICRRVKSITKDNERVRPDQCIITKGCLGRLLPIDETTAFEFTPQVAGVSDWFPRGQVRQVTATTVEAVPFTLSTSSSGSLVIAIKSADEPSLPTALYLALEQRRVGDVSFDQFAFRINATNNLTAGSTIISGKDSTGKNMRFDQTAIDESRIVVRVNGVEATPALTVNKITFTPALDLSAAVDVVVYSQMAALEKVIVFTRNKTLIPSLVRGAWSNIDFVDRLEPSGTHRWYLYSTDNIGDLTTGKIKITGNTVSSDAIFLLASTPYQSMDRYLNFIVPQSELVDDFILSSAGGELSGTTDILAEIFPPLIIEVDSFIAADLFTSTSSASIVTDTDLVRFSGKKILGPV